MSGAVTTFGWTSIPITTPPSAAFTSTMFRHAAEIRSAVKYYESSLSGNPDFTAMDAVASSVGLSSNPIDLASDMIAAYPTAPAWLSSAPADLQEYVISIASAEQSLYIDVPQPTGNAVYDAGALSAVAQMQQNVRNYEAGITAEPAFTSWAEVAATATGLDNIQPSRDPLSLAKELETGPTPTWYTQMPAALQTYIQSIVQEEANIYDSGIAANEGADADRPSMTNAGARLGLCTATVAATSFLIFLGLM